MELEKAPVLPGSARWNPGTGRSLVRHPLGLSAEPPHSSGRYLSRYMSPLAPQPQRPAANGGCRSASSAMIGEITVPGCNPRSRARQSAQRTSPGWSRRCCRTTLSVRLESITGQSSKRSPTRPSSSPPRLRSTASGRQRRAPGCPRSDVRTTPPCSTAATVASHRTSVDWSGLTRRESLGRTGDIAAGGMAGHARQPRWAGS